VVSIKGGGKIPKLMEKRLAAGDGETLRVIKGIKGGLKRTTTMMRKIEIPGKKLPNKVS